MALKKFFALSRFSGQVTATMQKLKSETKKKTKKKQSGDDQAATDDPTEDDATVDSSEDNGPRPKAWSKLRIGVAGKSAISTMLATSKKKRNSEEEDDELLTEEQVAKLTPEQRETLAKKEELRRLKEEYINATDVPGSTVLMAAAWKGDLAVMKLLVAQKANPNIVSILGFRELFMLH